MGGVIRSTGRIFRDALDTATGGLTNTGESEAERMYRKQREAEEARLKKMEEERKRAEEAEKAEKDYKKEVDASKEAAKDTGLGIDNTNVGLGDVKVDFTKLSGDKDDEDDLKKALKK